MPTFSFTFVNSAGKTETVSVDAADTDTALRALGSATIPEKDRHGTIDETMRFYHRHHPVAKRAEKRHAGHVRELIAVLGTRDPAMWDQNGVDEFKSLYAARGVKPTSTERLLKILHAAFAFAQHRKRLPATLSLKWDFLVPEVRRERILTRTDVAKILWFAHARRSRWAPTIGWHELYLWIAVFTGARPTAIQEMRWDQVDWDFQTIDFRDDEDGQHGKRRVVMPIARALMPVLRRAYREAPGHLRGQEFVLGCAVKNQVGFKDVRKVLTYNARMAGVDLGSGKTKVTNYTLRHTTASLLLREGVSPWAVAGLLGITVARLLKTYAKHIPSHLRESINRL